MTIIFGWALALIIAGLLMAYLSPGLKGGILTTVVYWAGVVLVIVGLILLVAPVVVWLDMQLRSMLGHQ